MRVVYILSIIVLAIGFMIHKKNDEKLNIIKWSMIFIISLIGFNVTICMILGLLKIKAYLWLLSLINFGLGVFLGYKPIKDKNFQKYEISKSDIASICVIITMFAVLVIRDIKPQDGGLKYAALDSAVHYRAAKCFSDNLIIFVNCEEKTIFNFNVMQTGAYINDGLLMNIANGLFGVKEYYVYEFFEISMILLTTLAFYSLIRDKIKTKFGFILTMGLLGLYMFAYPYNSYMYGFSYLSVGVMFTSMLIIVVQLLFDNEKIDMSLNVTLIALNAMGLIFSYCLFVPGVFAAICIYIFIKEFKQDGKKYFKFFQKKTLIITGILLLITIFGIGYLFIPTFFIDGQRNLVDALKNPGGMYSELYRNFVFYIPFGILYVVDIIIKFRKKEFHPEFIDIFSIVFGGYFCVAWVGMRAGVVSDYYFFKLYYILWTCILTITVKLVNQYINKKYFRYFISMYEFFWIAYVCFMFSLQTGTFASQATKVQTIKYAGIYTEENCNTKEAIRAFCNIKKDQIELFEFAKNIEDLKADNTMLISGSNNERAWALAIMDLKTENVKYNTIIEDGSRYQIKDGINKENVKYIVKIGQTDDLMDLEKYENRDGFEVLYKDERTFVLKVK